MPGKMGDSTFFCAWALITQRALTAAATTRVEVAINEDAVLLLVVEGVVEFIASINSKVAFFWENVVFMAL